jgi:hypothetical protein
MKRFLLIIAVLCFQVCAADAGGEMKEKERESAVGFVAVDGKKYSLRAATIEDIDDARLGIGEATRPDRKDRVAKGYFGVFVIENEAGEYAGKLFTGRMPIGVQPWPCEKGSVDEIRLGIIIKFYDWLLSIHTIDPNHTPAVRNTKPDIPIMLINNEVHAATAVLPTNAPFNTVAIQDALAILTAKLGFCVPPDADITPAGRPTLIISIGKTAPTTVDGSPSRVFRMPYYHAEDKDYADVKGMLHATVTSLLGLPIPKLPADIAGPLAAYVAALA